MSLVRPRILSLLCFFLCGSLPAAAAALGTSTRSAIPSDVQQLIVVDYRAMNDSPTARSLKERMISPRLRQFETALRQAGIVPEKEVEQLAFASFRVKGQGLQMVGLADGTFVREAVTRRLKLKGVRPQKYRLAPLYSMEGGMTMTFLDDSTLLFGEAAAVKLALQAHQGEIESLNANPEVSELMPGVEEGAVWSVLDAEGTRNMLRSALGQGAQYADYESLKKRLRGSRYVVDLSRGCDFNLDVLTSDSFTASTLSGLIQAGMMLRKMSASGAEKMALEGMTVESDSGKLKVHFKSDEKDFQSLLKSDLFAAVSK